MPARSVTMIIMMGAALLVGAGGTVLAAEPGATTTQPAAAAPASQPDNLAVSGSSGTLGSQVSFYLTRSLPANLQQRHLLAMRTLPRDEQIRWIHLTLRESQITIEETIRRKHQLDQLPRDVQDRYRQRALEIEDLFSTLSPSKLAELRSMKPEARAKEIRKLLAELRAKRIREGSPAK